ncbi:hypothetical protein [Streptomyces sp. enrichment culture]|uniref:hypothetical protein n=1 Tax=Streptomyces sp. enrichment culture TaxID=1795815 RepID=UPI003F56F9FA
MISRQKKRAWEDRLAKLTRAAQAAQDAVFVAIYEARQDGLSQADVAYMLGGVHPTGIKAKEEKGRAIRERRRGGNPT